MINDLKDLKALFKICRAQGITDFKMNGLEIKFGELPQTQSGSVLRASQGEDVSDPWSGFPTGELSPTQLAFYSAGGKPEDDPEFVVEEAI